MKRLKYPELQSHIGATLLIALLSVVARQADAQTTEALEACAAIEVEAQRLDCYDAVLRAPAGTPAADPVETPAAAPVPPEPPAAAPVTATETPEREAPPQRTDDSAVAEAVAEPEETRAERRARRKAERELERQPRTITIVAVEENFTGFTIFTADNGDVYVETSAYVARYPDPPFEAQLEAGSFGSFFMIPEGETKQIRVSLQE